VTGTPRTNRVREFRKQSRLTQAELGAAVDVSRQSIVSTEKGDYAPSVYLALRLARTLGTTVEELFPLTEEVSR
jgi:putative transcriptional regulator